MTRTPVHGGGPLALDEGAAALAALTGPTGEQLLDLALGTAGLRRVAARVHEVQHRPGDGVTVGFVVDVEAPDGQRAQEYLHLSSTRGRDIPPDAPRVVTLESPDGRVVAWRHPHDPALPALGTACDLGALAAVLPGDGPVTALELVGYRPLRRAVLRVECGGAVHWVKVLRPGGRGGADDVRHRHALLADLPVPAVTAATDDGLVVLAPADGVPLLEAIVADDARGLELDALSDLLDRVPAAAAALPARTAWSDRAARYAEAVAVDPALAARAHALADLVAQDVDLGPVVATHGDFHEGQLMVRSGATGWVVAGLLDVDTVGPGHRVDDLACLLAHALALGEAGRPVADRWWRQAVALVDERALRVRTAGVLLSLAAGAVHRPGVGPSADALLTDAEDLTAH
ncbi:phosphotransferase [Cellulomonas sp. PhB150]|uniref:phosphotransferase n=1 Tax=Cellulomonas sp. PhB150 TaxID=2485188 RepID=UPI000F47C95A|nr:phosphotransferase [Cellulomonas sp. PhB150]ROS31821.1 phosphotransferase family enzyme [Cellulomonas sp. PhB150]